MSNVLQQYFVMIDERQMTLWFVVHQSTCLRFTYLLT